MAQMQEGHRNAVLQKIRGVLQEGGVVGVMGWRMSHHTDFTRLLEETAKVEFFNGELRTIPERVKYFLIAPFLGHPDSLRLRKQRPDAHCPTMMQEGTIKKLFEDCRDVLPELEALGQARVAKSAPTPRKENELNEMERLTAAFKAQAAQHPDGGLTTHQLADLREKLQLKATPQSLQRQGWIVGKTREGKQKISFWVPGPEMERIGTEVLPTDPIKLAEYLITNKPRWEAKLAGAKAEHDAKILVLKRDWESRRDALQREHEERVREENESHTRETAELQALVTKADTAARAVAQLQALVAPDESRPKTSS